VHFHIRFSENENVLRVDYIHCRLNLNVVILLVDVGFP
jgi:hypothetical protein